MCATLKTGADMTKEQILDYLAEHKAEFAKKYHVKKIGLFGSFAKGVADENSDIDIFVEMRPEFDSLMALKFKLEESLCKRVDLIVKHKHMKPFLLQTLEKETLYV